MAGRSLRGPVRRHHARAGRPAPYSVSPGGTLRDRFPTGVLPSWLRERDLDVYAGAFERAGMTGALHRYRNVDRYWADLADQAGAPITQPSLFTGASGTPPSPGWPTP
ncbi:hypothetical protein C3492_33245 [Streptomyces sp. Ru62]|nr:hypothetical protein C3492_33245 [Streptomyces sp. Ru62]